jgi:hypothetical protein
VAFEDIGAGSTPTVVHTALIAANKKQRQTIADERTIAANLVRLLANSLKSRAAEQLLTAANFHPVFESGRSLSAVNLQTELLALSESKNSKFLCGLAVSRIARRHGFGLATEVLIPYARAGVPDDVIIAAEAAFKRANDAIVLMLPLVWLLGHGKGTTKASTVPRALSLDGVPSYALDKHTLIGHRSIRAFAKNCSAARTCLVEHVTQEDSNNAAYMAAFYADGAPLASRYTWEGSEEIERLAVEADLMKTGLVRQGIDPVLQAFRANIDQLNKLRAYFFYRARGYVDAVQALLPNEWVDR